MLTNNRLARLADLIWVLETDIELHEEDGRPVPEDLAAELAEAYEEQRRLLGVTRDGEG